MLDITVNFKAKNNTNKGRKMWENIAGILSLIDRDVIHGAIGGLVKGLIQREAIKQLPSLIIIGAAFSHYLTPVAVILLAKYAELTVNSEAELMGIGFALAIGGSEIYKRLIRILNKEERHDLTG